ATQTGLSKPGERAFRGSHRPRGSGICARRGQPRRRVRRHRQRRRHRHRRRQRERSAASAAERHRPAPTLDRLTARRTRRPPRHDRCAGRGHPVRWPHAVASRPVGRQLRLRQRFACARGARRLESSRDRSRGLARRADRNVVGPRDRPVHHAPGRHRKTMMVRQADAANATTKTRKHEESPVQRRLCAFVPSWLCLIVVSSVAIGCRAPARPALRAVSLPDLARAAPSVRTQLGDRYAALMRTTSDPKASPSDLANAYGAMGALLMAAEYREEAEACLLNAESLAPGELKWPYYLAHLYKDRGEVARSQAAFERALRVQPRHVPALVWLGETYLDQGRPEAAQPLFERAL